VNGVDDLGAIDPLEVDARDAEVRVAELALDHNQRDTFVRHFDRMGVSQLMWGESPTDASCRGRVVQLLASCRRFPVSPGGRSVNDAHQGANREPAPDLKPRVELRPRPSVHTDLAALSSLPAPNKDRSASTIEVALMKRERLADSETGTPEQHNECAESASVGAIADGSHDCDDLLHGRRVGRVLLAFVSWRAPAVVAGHRRRRAAVARNVEHDGLHDLLPCG
jgi:hypothetical protein